MSYHRLDKAPVSYLDNLLTLVHAGHASKHAVFELQMEEGHVLMAGTTRLALVLSRYDILDHLNLVRDTHNQDWAHSLDSGLLDWLIARNSRKYVGTMFTFAEGMSAPAEVPLMQTSGDLAEGYLIGPLVEMVYPRALAVATAAHKLVRVLGHDLRYVLSAEKTPNLVDATTDAVAAYTAGFNTVDDMNAHKAYRVPLTRPIMYTYMHDVYANEQEAWKAHLKFHGNATIFEVEDIAQMRRLIDFSEAEEFELGAVMVSGNLKDASRLLGEKVDINLYLKVSDHTAILGLKNTSIDRMLSGVVYTPGSDTNLWYPKLRYVPVEIEGKPTRFSEIGRSYPVRTPATNEIKVHSYAELMKDPTPLRQGYKKPIVFPVFRKGVLNRPWRTPDNAIVIHSLWAANERKNRHLRAGEFDDC